MRVDVDNSMCQGHGRCYMLAPEVFDMDDEGLAVVTQTEPGTEYFDAVRKAEANCPEGAVKVSGQ
ncbi:ferredoxin [Gordonia sp. KTR9]|uniref:ferredoxin n=1 Tax=Gordonia sp. KTR9 TaxID=337191 RepID=UPI0005CAC143|nr:ferredoxin [Gordonia sp. KTR9]